MSKRIRKIAGVLFVLALSAVMLLSMTACSDNETPAVETPEETPVVENQTPVVEPDSSEVAVQTRDETDETAEGTTINFTGPAEFGLTEELVYTISAANTSGLATATFRLELDAAYVDEPIVEGVNGFTVLMVDFEEVDGKWVGETVMMNLAGMTETEETEVAKVYALNRGVSGTATATLTEAVLSAYVGEDSEDWVDVIYGTTTVETTLS